jgi:hypothetical protein
MRVLTDQQIYDIRLLFYSQKKSYGEIRGLTGHSLSTISKYCWRDRDSAQPPLAAAAAKGKS